MTKILIALLSFLVAAAAPAAGHASIVGKARVIDGDTLEIAGTRLRLEGIDAPESEQKCVIGQQVWHCGRNAEFALSDLVGRHWVACRVVGHDAAGTTLAVCHLAGFEGPEINHEMVKGGWAVADPRTGNRYQGAERSARDAKKGIWSSRFIAPGAWRGGRRLLP